MKRKRPALTLVGKDDTGFFKVTVPEGGRFTIAPAGQGLGPYALRIYRDHTNASILLFNPGVHWVREEGLEMQRPISDPNQIVEQLLEITGFSLMDNTESSEPREVTSHIFQLRQAGRGSMGPVKSIGPIPTRTANQYWPAKAKSKYQTIIRKVARVRRVR